MKSNLYEDGEAILKSVDYSWQKSSKGFYPVRAEVFVDSRGSRETYVKTSRMWQLFQSDEGVTHAVELWKVEDRQKLKDKHDLSA